MTVERKAIDGRVPERRDIFTSRESTDLFTFTFTGLGVVTDAVDTATLNVWDRPGGTLIGTTNTTSWTNPGGPDPTVDLGFTSAAKKAWASDDPEDVVALYYEVILTVGGAPVKWFEGDFPVEP